MSTSKTRLTRPEEMFLLGIAVASTIACATSLYVGYHTNKVVAAMEQEEEDGPRVPLPAGPRRYQ